MNKLQKIKAILFSSEVEEQVEIKFEYVTVDEIQYKFVESIAIDAEVYTVTLDEAGLEVVTPVTDMELTLEDGKKVIIVAGKVTEIIEPTVEEVEEVEVIEVTPIEEGFEKFSVELTSLFKENFETLNTTIDDLKKRVLELEKQPASEGLKTIKTGVNFSETKKDRLDVIASYRNK